MIKLPETIYVATAPTNMHLSFDRLAGIVRDQLGADRLPGVLRGGCKVRGNSRAIVVHGNLEKWRRCSAQTGHLRQRRHCQRAQECEGGE